MKGRTTVKLNQATAVEAMQLYFDSQLKVPHVVKSVRRDPEHSPTGPDEFEVELEAAAEDQPNGR